MPVNEAVFDTPEGLQRADLYEVFEKTKDALTIQFDSVEGASYYSAIRSYHRATLVLPHVQLTQLWADMTYYLEQGDITQAEFDDLSARIGDPDEIPFVDPETGQTTIFTMTYAQSINDRVASDVEYKQTMEDAWKTAALNHYAELTAELNSLL